MTFNECTRAQMAARIRQRFKASQGMETLKIARWINTNLTDAEIRAVFGLTQAQVTALRTRLQAKVETLTAVETAGGE